jgi:release factor glutamine methyltransferase
MKGRATAAKGIVMASAQAFWSGGSSAERPLVEFMGVYLEVDGDVLVPREETELLARAALSLLADRPAGQIVVDMCCGSGNLALAVAAHEPDARVWAGDLTDATVAVARRNVSRLGFEDRVRIGQGDLFESLACEGLEGRVDLVMCNPPYISTARLDGERANLLLSEPREAFDGGPYGISILQRLVRESLSFLKIGGWLAFEFGHGQERQALALIKRSRAYEEPLLVSEDTGAPRVALARRRS